VQFWNVTLKLVVVIIIPFIGFNFYLFQGYVPKTDTYKRRPRREGEPELAGVTPEGHFDEEHCALYFVDLLHGLAHLHRHHIVHRDLKPEVCQNSLCFSDISLFTFNFLLTFTKMQNIL
jgi:serine/threonine protein kinase